MQGKQLWVIVRKLDGELMIETFSEKLVAALNQQVYCAIPILQWLCAFNRSIELQTATS